MLLSADAILMSLVCKDNEQKHLGTAAGTVLEECSTVKKEMLSVSEKDGNWSS